MRTRARHAVERRIAAWAPGTSVVWCRDLPDGSYGAAQHYSATEAWIYLSEALWDAGTPEERADTLAHEVAHVLAWRECGLGIAPHGREWRRHFEALTES